MKLALIPPTDLLDYTGETDYQLMLPQQMLNDGLYYETYKALCEHPEQYVILDNGVAEEVPFDWDPLVQMAIFHEVDELVIPDKMLDYEGNIQTCISFCAGHASLLKDLGIKLMFVTQATNWEDLMSSIDFAAHTQDIDTIGIPRHLVETIGNANVRAEAAMYANERTDKPVHLLGASPSVPTELRVLVWSPNVRGTDTSSPFNFAFKGLTLDGGHVRVSRPDDYFNLTYDDFPMHIVDDNIVMLKEWCE
jgi:hypothetical protein